MTAIVSVASECAPLVKTGGLADVVGALPKALAALGHDMRVVLPAYPEVAAQAGETRPVLEEGYLFGGPGRLVAAEAAGLRLYLVEAAHLYDRAGGIYNAGGHDWPDNPERFAALSWMAARLAAEGDGDWRPDLLHAHDWQGGFAPIYLGGRRPSVVTVHNIAFLGMAPAERRRALKLPEEGFGPDGYEFWGQVSALKAGLVWADRITTVSPTYASELMTPEFGMGLDGLIRHRADRVKGILNGIDAEVWDPAGDPHIPPYSTPRGKAKAESALLAEAGLEPGAGPVACVVSRLTWQKGLDLLYEAIGTLLSRDGRLVLLGSGEPGLEDAYRRLGDLHPGVAVRIGYDEALSHRVIAGSDAIVIPSRFEPCGLTQLYGLRYGCLPLVARTGGLADTVIDANEAALAAGVATGFQFAPVTAGALADAIDRACDVFADRAAWQAMMRRAMRHPVGWDRSAVAYRELYRGLIEEAADEAAGDAAARPI
jgi:starch synthase